MIRSRRRPLAFLAICVIALCSMLTIPIAGAAAPVVGGKQCNIYLVVDSSGSLDMKNDPAKSSDPEGHRYNALDYFFSIMPSSAGHEMGASVFSSSSQEVAALKVVRSQADKDAIKSRIEAVPPVGNTDIGAALLNATQKLVSRQRAQDKAEGQHKESWVLLFTDGLTDTGSSAGNTVSESKRDQAIALANANGINIAGVFLNDKSAVTKNAAAQGQNPQEVFNIVRAGRGQDTDPSSPNSGNGASNNLDGYYAEITDAADIADAFNALAHTILGGNNPTVETVPVDKSQLIPGVGVSELIFSVRYAPSVQDKVSISILNPDNKTYFNAQDNVSVKSSNVFYSANIKDPLPGTWYIHVGRSGKTPVTEDIQVIPDILVSTDVVAKLEQAQPVIRKGEPFQVNAWLEKQGQRITDNARYSGYEVSLTIVNSETKQVSEPVSMGIDGEGTFLVLAKLDDFSAYMAYATFTCGDNISFRSESIPLRANNQPPKLSDSAAANEEGTLAKDTYNFTRFGTGKYKVDLDKFVVDPEGDKKLTYTAGSSSYAAANVAGESTELIVDTQKKAGAGTIHLTASDSDGGRFAFDLQLTAKDVTLYWLIGFVGCILLLLALFFLVRRRINGNFVEAEMAYEIEGSTNPYIQQLQGDNKAKIRVAKMGDLGNSFGLYNLCKKFVKRAVADPAVSAELENFFDRYKPKLGGYTFKSRPGPGCFTFICEKDGTRSKEAGAPGSFSTRIQLDDNVYLHLRCPERKSLKNKNTEPQW